MKGSTNAVFADNGNLGGNITRLQIGGPASITPVKLAQGPLAEERNCLSYMGLPLNSLS
jgi:hypothetical protein